MVNKLFFDFDKTLVRVNSFPFWIVFVIGYSLVSFRFNLTLNVLKLLIERKVKKDISHYHFKYELLRLPISENCNGKFAFILSLFVRKKLLRELKNLKETNHLIAISSAAPETYLKSTIQILLPKIYQDLTIIGSKIGDDGKLIDNYKGEKLNNLYKFQFLEYNEKLKNIFTDSWDDSEIACQSDFITLVSPSKKNKRKYLESPKLSKKIIFFKRN